MSVVQRTILFLSLISVLCAGCASALQKRGDQAFERGDFVGAAQFYEEADHEKPGKESLVAKLWTARARAIDELTTRARGARSSTREQDIEAALATARATAETRNRWYAGVERSRLDPAAHQRVDELSAWAVATVTASVRKQLEAQKPLAAQRGLERRMGLFQAAGLEVQAKALADDIGLAGRARCGELKQRTPQEAAHLAYWVAKFCQLFGEAAPPVPVAPEQVSALKIELDSLAPTTPSSAPSWRASWSGRCSHPPGFTSTHRRSHRRVSRGVISPPSRSSERSDRSTGSSACPTRSRNRIWSHTTTPSTTRTVRRTRSIAANRTRAVTARAHERAAYRSRTPSTGPCRRRGK
jgi:hypothetical protein